MNLYLFSELFSEIGGAILPASKMTEQMAAN